MLSGRHDSPLFATLSGLLDQLRPAGNEVAPLAPDARLDGLTTLVTGASSGLGRAIATDLAARGARVLMACRSGIPEAGEAIRKQTGNDAVEMWRVHLDDLESVHQLADRLRDEGVRLDRLVINAAVMPVGARRTRQGFEEMFAVNYLANYVLITRLLADGVLPRGVGPAGDTPRLVIVSSEAHRTAAPLDWARFGDFVEYNAATGMKQYGHTKLCLSTLAQELSRRLQAEGRVEVAVHSLCPGAVATNIAREAPPRLKPLIDRVMRAWFRSPEDAAAPVLYLVGARAIESQTGLYLHMLRPRDPSEAARDLGQGARLMARSEALVAPFASAALASDTRGA